jgi:hypothetical protein
VTSTAIVIGNADYSYEQSLPCCLEDVAAMKALIEATGRYAAIHALTDLDADAMREAFRDLLPATGSHDEVLFYFYGHGAQVGTELYYCGTQFDSARPNETGVSNTELHNLLRAAQPNLLVKIIDACFSGALLIKAERQPFPVTKEGFRHVLQFSSSLDDQTSLAGEPLSAFTRAFCEASVRKSEGPVYFTDVANTLRDDFLGNEDQTPFFVSQGTGRELLTDDASKFNEFRQQLETRWKIVGEHGDEETNENDAALVVAEPPTAKQLLMAAEARMGGPEGAKQLIDSLFDGVIARFGSGSFAEFFETKVVEHNDYQEPSSRDHIIRVLSRENRPDRMVTAEIKKRRKGQTHGIHSQLRYYL